MVLIYLFYLLKWRARWRSSLMHCVGSSPDSIFGVFINLVLRSHSGCGVDSAANRNEYLGIKGGRCVGLTTLLPSFANCVGILEASTSWSPNSLSRFTTLLSAILTFIFSTCYYALHQDHSMTPGLKFISRLTAIYPVSLMPP